MFIFDSFYDIVPNTAEALGDLNFVFYDEFWAVRPKTLSICSAAGFKPDETCDEWTKTGKGETVTDKHLYLDDLINSNWVLISVVLDGRTVSAFCSP